MAQQAAGAPVTVREAIQVRDEGDARDARVERERDRFVARDRISIGWIARVMMGRSDRCVDETRGNSMGWRLTGRVV